MATTIYHYGFIAMMSMLEAITVDLSEIDVNTPNKLLIVNF